MYKVYAYDYPQCGAGLYPLLNCKIIELSDDYQPRKDGNTGYDAMVPINPGKIALAKYRKDDVRSVEVEVNLSYKLTQVPNGKLFSELVMLYVPL
jgi:hypothetical protein